MPSNEFLAEQFEADRPRLRAVAHRMLGSMSEADDAVQESWIRLSRSDVSGVGNLSGWLTTVVARVCLDMLRSRKSRREEPIDAKVPEKGVDPEQDVLMADSVGLAMLVVLETLPPAERVAFVLHDMFDLPFDEIAPIVGRTPQAARQLASRGRRRVRGAEPGVSGPANRKVVDAFLAASRGGDFRALLALLDPNVVLRGDAAAVQMGTGKEIRGADRVAETFAGRARAARPALIDGMPGLLWAPGGQPRVVFRFTIANEKVTEIEMIADPDRIEKLELSY
jgi:RNA polymerase sigma factor (sigma-70 family)